MHCHTTSVRSNHNFIYAWPLSLRNPAYRRGKKSKKNKSKQVIQGFDHVPDGFHMPMAKSKPPAPAPKEPTNLASYQKQTENARRKKEPPQKKKKKKKSDILRHAVQIGSTEEHIEHGIGVIQHSDTDELHRNIRERTSVLPLWINFPIVARLLCD